MTDTPEVIGTRNDIRAGVPRGWFVKQSWTLLSPDGQANIIISREPLAPEIDTRRYAETQGDLLRKEFPRFRELVFGPVRLACGPAFMRIFEWTPPDGVPVRQMQLYHAQVGRGYTATATTPTTHADRFRGVFEHVLRGLDFGQLS